MSIQKDKIAIVVIFALQLALLSLDMKNFLCVCGVRGRVCSDYTFCLVALS